MKKQVIAYDLLTGLSPNSINAQVKEAIAAGWQPLGGPIGIGERSLAQAVVKYGQAAAK